MKELAELQAQLQDKNMQLMRAADEQQRLRKALLDAEIDMQVCAAYLFGAVSINNSIPTVPTLLLCN